MNSGATALNATGAQVGGFLTWRAVSTRGLIILEHASANQLADEVASWPERGQLRLNGFDYKGFANGAPRDAEDRLAWLDRQSEFTPQPYEQLVGVLRRLGHDGDARKVAIRKQVRLRKSGLLSKRSQAWSYFLGFVVAHGYRPSRAFVFAVVVVLFGWWVFSHAADKSIMMPAREEAYTGETAPAGSRPPVKTDYPQLVALLYSLDVFLPVVNLHQEDYWLPDASKQCGLWYLGYMWAHIVLGCILTTVLLAALAGLIKKD